MSLKPNEKLLKLLAIAGLSVGFVFVTRKEDPLEDNIIVKTLNRTDFEGWDFAHMGLHFCITAMNYENYIYSLFLSLVWEFVEKLMAEDDDYWKDDGEHDYKVNTLGMLVGMLYNVYFIRK